MFEPTFTRAVISLTVGMLGTLALAACGGSGGDSTPSEKPTAQTDSESNSQEVYANLLRDAQVLSERTVGMRYTDFQTLPSNGSAQFEGYIGGAIRNGATSSHRLMGEATLELAFGSSNPRLAGRFDSFVDESGDEWRGRLRIRDGRLDGDADQGLEPGLIGRVEGTLERPNGREFDMRLQLEGFLYGRNYRYVSGRLAGDVSNTSTTGTFLGEFVLQKD